MAKASDPAPAPKRRDSARTRQRILEAAMEEFTAKGFAGARVEAVAERADVNVRSLYKYFGSKEGLYAAVFGDSFAHRHDGVIRAIEEVAEDPIRAETLITAFHRALADNPAFTRLMTWDAMSVDPDDPESRVVAADVRGEMYNREIALLRDAQRASGVWRGLDPDLLLIAFMALAIYPMVTRPMTLMISGQAPEQDVFRKRWDDFLVRIGEALAGGAVPAAVDRLPADSVDDNRLLRIAARALARAGLVDAYGHCSLRVDDSAFLVTAPIPMGLLTNERGTVVPVDGPLPDGVLGEVRLHQAIYRRRPEVRAIARVLPPSVRALSALGRTARPLDGFGSYFAPSPPLYDVVGLVRDDGRAAAVAECLGAAPAVVLRGGGAVVVGESLPQAVVLARYLEDASAVDLAASAGGGRVRPMTKREVAERATWTGDILERMWAYLTHGDPEI